MSFSEKATRALKTTGKAITKAVVWGITELEKYNEKVREARERLQVKSDDDLIRIIGSSGIFESQQTDKNVAIQILKDRGHSTEEIARRIRK